MKYRAFYRSSLEHKLELYLAFAYGDNSCYGGGAQRTPSEEQVIIPSFIRALYCLLLLDELKNGSKSWPLL